MKKNNTNANGGRENPVRNKFRKIPSMKFLYEVNEFGDVRNIKSKKILKADISKDGYYRVQGKREWNKRSVAQLVLEVWGPKKPSDKHEVDHIDRDPANNHIVNLRWVTKSENLKNRDYTNITPPRITVRIKMDDLETGKSREFESMTEVCNYFGTESPRSYIYKGWIYKNRWKFTRLERVTTIPDRE